jgi:tyrosyl-tRNA synthetase
MAASSESFPPVAEQLSYLRKGVVDLLVEEELRRKLERSRSGRSPLTVKVGFDPSTPDIHLGHTVLMRKMKHFQDLGHRVVFLIGDFTGLIGDPTGRSKTRPQLTEEEIQQNAETYKAQAFHILDPERTVVDFNSRWLGELGSFGFVRLAARYSVARMLERRDFRERYERAESIRLHEFLYPLAQAYDSVFLKADVELGGTDQLFNLNVGRDIMPAYDLEPQIVMTTPLLVGTDGVDKMSKSLGNTIGVEEPPREMFGKVMSISDALMWTYFTLLTDVSEEEIGRMRGQVESGDLHPRAAKVGLARRLVADFHGDRAAASAEEEFERVFAEGGLPDDVVESKVPCDGPSVWLPKLLVSLGAASSNGEARRLIRGGGVRIEGERVEAEDQEVEPPGPYLIQVGKRRFYRVRLEGKEGGGP